MLPGAFSSRRGFSVRAALCVALSLALHVGLLWCAGLGWGWVRFGGGGVVRPVVGAPRVRAVRLVSQVSRSPAFVKTDPDQVEALPQQADFIGKRSSVESAAAQAPARRSEEPLPSQEGVVSEAEVVTFDQERQEGDVRFDGPREQRRVLAQDEAAALPQVSHQEVALPEVRAPEAPEQGVAAVLPLSHGAEGDLRVRQAEVEEVVRPHDLPHQVAPHEESPPGRGVRPVVYDPSLAAHAQQQQRPGFRALERRTRSSGRFVVGNKPALNVAATPLGRYEEEVYRRVAFCWYVACDEHRGDIVPGSVVISLRINARGLLENMELVRRSGASMSQQAFTFGAIRRASLPPMPPAVQQEMVGDLLELIFHFNFD